MNRECQRWVRNLAARKASRSHRLKCGPHLAGEDFRLLPSREVAAAARLVEAREIRVNRLDPTAGCCEDLAREGREADGRGDRRRSLAYRLGCGLSPPPVPVPAGRRCAGSSEPVQGDVVKDAVSGEATHRLAVDEGAG